MPKQPTQAPAAQVQATARPTMGPRASAASETDTNQSQPQDLSTFGSQTLAETAAMPTLEPPASASIGAATGTWLNGKKVTALWSINQNRNVWAAYDGGVGWKKFANNSDSAIMAFSILSASAKLTQTITNHREEADGMVYEIYVW
ncbi:MAG: hypothetical protein C4332_03975 [Meiothermus sp.]